ncbi:hypothetical protein [Chryseobacterium sp. JV558]|uniref:hypothetical protein n=1 Tax=Chryseobacterium sp. JV558 TaxID=2663236 RepID=UPI00299D78CC|nr:hypothetical protein [Chryseobacterium sp. JV558]MDW9380857.1 hypothetical protein [Chryseobacterium sp. JV558]
MSVPLRVDRFLFGVAMEMSLVTTSLGSHDNMMKQRHTVKSNFDVSRFIKSNDDIGYNGFMKYKANK